MIYQNLKSHILARHRSVQIREEVTGQKYISDLFSVSSSDKNNVNSHSVYVDIQYNSININDEVNVNSESNCNNGINHSTFPLSIVSLQSKRRRLSSLGDV